MPLSPRPSPTHPFSREGAKRGRRRRSYDFPPDRPLVLSLGGRTIYLTVRARSANSAPVSALPFLPPPAMAAPCGKWRLSPAVPRIAVRRGGVNRRNRCRQPHLVAAECHRYTFASYPTPQPMYESLNGALHYRITDRNCIFSH